jgi:hypothetical protein
MAFFAVLSCSLSVSLAVPRGDPPPRGFTVHQFWSNCSYPVKVRMQSTALAYPRRDRNSTPAERLYSGQRVSIVDQVDILVSPGIAVVTGFFERNSLNLQPGAEVYVLQEWDINYFHAWFDGKLVDGGLPIGEPGAFEVKASPKVERWIKIRPSRFTKRTLWALDSEAFSDQDAAGKCERAY